MEVHSSGADSEGVSLDPWWVNVDSGIISNADVDTDAETVADAEAET